MTGSVLPLRAQSPAGGQGLRERSVRRAHFFKSAVNRTPPSLLHVYLLRQSSVAPGSFCVKWGQGGSAHSACLCLLTSCLGHVSPGDTASLSVPKQTAVKRAVSVPRSSSCAQSQASESSPPGSLRR